jgi:uncharacterized caspase-like protein
MSNNSTYQSKYTNSWALVIGVNQYKYAPPLNHAVNDAKAIADILQNKYKFPKENVSLLLDKDATAKNIRKVFSDYADVTKVGVDDRLLVFFAGHGHTITSRRGEVGFLVPVDGKVDDMTTLIRWDNLTRDADFISAKHIFFLMDACYGGLALLRTPFGNMRFLGDMLQRFTRQVLTAGKADEPVADGNGVRPGHSMFTGHLLEALDGGASTEEGIITASGVMAYVYERVSRDQYSLQTPHYGFIDGDGDFIFDTSPLDNKRAISKKVESQEGESGEEDILVNPSPQIDTNTNSETPISEKVKELLSDPSKKIKLDDYITLHIKRFLETTDLRYFPVQQANVQKEDFLERLSKYEDAIKDLQQIVILLSKWGDKEQLLLLEKIFIRLAEADKGSAGLIMWIRLNWYPIMILMYSAGITALANKKYDVLKIVLQTTAYVESVGHSGQQTMVVSIGTNMSELSEAFKWLPGQEKKYVPRSEHLFKILQPTLEDMLFLGRSYESLFDAFEVMFALVYSDITGLDWGPPGRFAWKYRSPFNDVNPFNQIVDEAKKEQEKWGPIRASLFDSSINKFIKVSDSYREILKRLSWF